MQEPKSKGSKGRKSRASAAPAEGGEGGEAGQGMDLDDEDDDEDGGHLKIPKKRGKASGHVKSACVPPPLKVSFRVRLSES